MLGVGDTFNLTIFTGASWDTNLCFWNAWNETSCSAETDESLLESKPFYINESYLEEEGTLDINSTNINRWGQG